MRYVFGFILTLPMWVIIFLGLASNVRSEDNNSRFYEAKMAIRERLNTIAETHSKKKPDAISQHLETLSALMQIEIAYPEIKFKVTHEAYTEVSLITATVKYEDNRAAVAWRFDTLFRPEGTYLFETPFTDINVVPELDTENTAYLRRRYE